MDKYSVLSTLAHRDRTACYQEILPGELEFLYRMVEQNSHNETKVYPEVSDLSR
jgi:hypothetical protein